MSKTVHIQFDRGNGQWITISTIIGPAATGQQINHSMKQVQRQRPKDRIRAVDQDGRLIDML